MIVVCSIDFEIISFKCTKNVFLAIDGRGILKIFFIDLEYATACVTRDACQAILTYPFQRRASSKRVLACMSDVYVHDTPFHALSHS